MEIIYLPAAVDDVTFWKKSGNKSIQNKIKELIIAIQENPFEGIGKPEQLKHKLSGSWSRRINQEHRLIYNVKIDVIEMESMRGHYYI